MATNSAKYLSTLHKQIDQYFSFSEVRTLCFNLGVDYENIPGDHRSAFVRNLIVSLAKQSRLQELIDEVRAERPRVDWQNVPADFELPSSIAEENIQQVVNYHVYAGDVVQGDKIGGDKVSGDKISVGNIENAKGVAIGSGASAAVTETSVQPTAVSPTTIPEKEETATTDLPKALATLQQYLQMAATNHPEAAQELTTSIQLIQSVAGADPVNKLHLRLLCLGQLQLAKQLNENVPGIEQVVEGFVTAVQQ